MIGIIEVKNNPSVEVKFMTLLERYKEILKDNEPIEKIMKYTKLRKEELLKIEI